MNACGCSNRFRPKDYVVVCSCSGASDTGCIADRAARALAAEKIAKMSCTAAIAAQDEEISEWTVAAAKVLLVDGCEKDCARKIFEARGFSDLLHVRVTDLGMEKGKTPVTDDAVQQVLSAAKALLG